MTKAYDILFEQRLWKEAFTLLPLDKEVEINVKSTSDLPIIRVRASEYNKTNTQKRRLSVSLNYNTNTAKITAKHK